MLYLCIGDTSEDMNVVSFRWKSSSIDLDWWLMGGRWPWTPWRCGTPSLPFLRRLVKSRTQTTNHHGNPWKTRPNATWTSTNIHCNMGTTHNQCWPSEFCPGHMFDTSFHPPFRGLACHQPPAQDREPHCFPLGPKLVDLGDQLIYIKLVGGWPIPLKIPIYGKNKIETTNQVYRDPPENAEKNGSVHLCSMKIMGLFSKMPMSWRRIWFRKLTWHFWGAQDKLHPENKKKLYMLTSFIDVPNLTPYSTSSLRSHGDFKSLSCALPP